jgi:hypothetical protein
MEKYKFIMATMWYVVKKILVSISCLDQARGSEGDRAGGMKKRLSGTSARWLAKRYCTLQAREAMLE